MSRGVHQVLATLGYGDAIGHEVLGIQRTLQSAGYESEIFVETADRRLESLTTDYRDMVGSIDEHDILIHHFSIGSRASRTAYALPGRMALVYHNITPPEYFIGVHQRLVKLCYQGRRELTAYIGRCDLALGRLRVQSPGARRARVRRHRRPAGRARLLPSRCRAEHDGRRRLRRWLDQHPVCRPRHSEQEVRGHHPRLPRVSPQLQPAVTATPGRLVQRLRGVST